MRSPQGISPVIKFCANCQGVPKISTSTAIPQLADTNDPANLSRSTSSASHLSRSSTPPTEISEEFVPQIFSPPPETEETRRRREQSDRASSEIGNRLLKGWAMLGEECPNSTCFGVPLVRPPKAGGEKDPRKECVICGNVYITDVDYAGRESMILAGNDTSLNGNNAAALSPYLAPSKAAIALTSNESDQQPRREPIQLSTSQTLEPVTSAPSASLALDESSQALQATLQSLSLRLRFLTSAHPGLDVASIGSTADAISKVTQALTHVKQLQWSERQAIGFA